VRLINDLQPQKGAGFLGIDLTSKEAKPSACLGLGRELNLIYLGFLNRDSDFLQVVRKYEFELIAIDAPLSLPKGLCCLEDSCSCQPVSEVKGRNCERELAKLGIPCYFTTKKSIIKAMVYRGIKLKTELCGEPEEGTICLPLLDKVTHDH
jgi:predicted nuclease with RNAse H fold